MLAIGACDVHKETDGLDVYLGEEGWVTIVKGFKAAGRPVPERERTILEWRSIDNPDAAVQLMVRFIAERQADAV